MRLFPIVSVHSNTLTVNLQYTHSTVLINHESPALNREQHLHVRRPVLVGEEPPSDYENRGLCTPSPLSNIPWIERLDTRDRERTFAVKSNGTDIRQGVALSSLRLKYWSLLQLTSVRQNPSSDEQKKNDPLWKHQSTHSD